MTKFYSGKHFLVQVLYYFCNMGDSITHCAWCSGNLSLSIYFPICLPCSLSSFLFINLSLSPPPYPFLSSVSIAPSFSLSFSSSCSLPSRYLSSPLSHSLPPGPSHPLSLSSSGPPPLSPSFPIHLSFFVSIRSSLIPTPSHFLPLPLHLSLSKFIALIISHTRIKHA